MIPSGFFFCVCFSEWVWRAFGVSNDNYPVRKRREAKLEERREYTLSVSRRTKVVEENFLSKIREKAFFQRCHSHSRGVVKGVSQFFGTLDMAPDGFRKKANGPHFGMGF